MKRNKFSLSHFHNLTCNCGWLVPIANFAVLPGDTVQQASALLIRTQPLLAPVMHPLKIRIHHWFVPYRIIFDDWPDFITGGEDGLQTPTWPHIDLNGDTIAESSLEDYMGIPPQVHAASFKISALPFRAYSLIFNEHYRDQQLVTELTIDTTDGADTTTNRTIQSCAWEKDRFTAARGATHLGSTVTIPFSGESPIFGDNMDFDDVEDNANYAQVRNAAGASAALRQLKASGTVLYGDDDTSGTGELKADLSQATGMDINELRVALATQRFQERMNNYGARYSEYLRGIGIRGPRVDARLQEPEYLGGGSRLMSFSEVLATDDANTGKMKGHGIAAVKTRRYRRFFEEHGIVMSLMSVLPKTIYGQGVHREYNKQTKEDYFQREFQHIGEQAILNREIYSSHSSPDGTHGYAPQYDEYRSHPSFISGEFNTTLNHWHMARIFSGDTALNSSFVTANPTNRIYLATGSDQLYVQAAHSIQVRRAMAKHGTPKLF